jgi:fucose 4-O-acetylase-like acetyltransferase
MAMGSAIRLAKPENLERVMGWTLGIGVTAMVAAYQLASLPYSVYSKVDFWLDSPALTTFKLGVSLCILSVAYLWMKTGVVRWSLCRQLGVTSLLVYWVHIELVYGRWFGIFKERMDIPQVVTFTILLIGLMVFLSVLRTRRRSLLSPFRSPSPVRAESPSGS